MKHLNHILERSNLTPLERMTALVHNDLHREKTGKDILSDAQIRTITHNWTGHSGEINEYNRYAGIARLESTMRMDALMFATNAELALVKNQRVLTHCLDETKRSTKLLTQEITKGVTEEESIRFATTHTYLDYQAVLHTFTFFNLPQAVQADLLILDESVSHSRQYLENEVILFEMFKSGKLSKKNKERLIDTIFSRLYYDGIRKLRRGTERDCFLVGGYFAELPLTEVVNRVAHDTHIKWKDRDQDEILDDIESCTKREDVTMEHLTRESLSAWLDDGLFTSDFVPIFNSDRHDTWNGDTKQSHKELFALWCDELEKSKQYFEGLFSTRKLKLKKVEINILGGVIPVEMITGDSLYACREDMEFVREYKQQLEKILQYTNLALFIEKYAKPIKNYQTLCTFKGLAQEVGTIFDADLGTMYDELIKSYKEEAMLLNHELRKLTDAATEHLYKNIKDSPRYELHITDGKFGFELEGSEGTSDGIVEQYREEFKKLGIKA